MPYINLLALFAITAERALFFVMSKALFTAAKTAFYCLLFGNRVGEAVSAYGINMIYFALFRYEHGKLRARLRRRRGRLGGLFLFGTSDNKVDYPGGIKNNE